MLESLNLGKHYLYLTAITAWIGTYLMIRGATRLGLVDQPNARSSHSNPTPRGAGIAVFVAVVAGSIAVWIFEDISGLGLMTLPTMIMCGLAVAAVGWIDDLRSLSARIRLSVHLLSSAIFWTVLFSKGFNSVQGVHDWVSTGIIILILTISTAWFINLTNFMDGLNGILGVQTLTVSFAAAFLSAKSGDLWISSMFLVLAASMVGFLPWNIRRSKIFMGDVGSGFIGFWMAILFALAIARQTLTHSEALILNAVFLVDTAYTLIRRALRGQNPTQAHKSHAYQKLNQLGWSHDKVSLAVGLLNVFVLVPLAYFSKAYPVITILPIGFLAFTCWKLKAGQD
jgi:Fuc2NAc and GlcNAc transferase